MKSCISHLIGEYEDAREYYDLAIHEDGKCKAIYRDLASDELEHLEHCMDVYRIKTNERCDEWLEFFKGEADKLKDKLRQL